MVGESVCIVVTETEFVGCLVDLYDLFGWKLDGYHPPQAHGE